MNVNGNTPVLSAQRMRELGFTDHVPEHWYWHGPVDHGVSLNVTIDKKTGDYQEGVINEWFGQHEFYGRMRPEFRDKVQAAIDEHLARLNGAGLTITVDARAYGWPDKH